MKTSTSKKGLNLNAKSFITAIIVIFVLMIATYVLTLFVSSGSYERVVDKNGNIFQFEREGGEFEISKEKIDIQSPFAWSELWKIIYLKEYDKNLCELSEQEVSEYYGRIGANGSIQKFVKWYTNEYKG